LKEKIADSRIRILALCILAILFTVPADAQKRLSDNDEAAIRALFQMQQDAWNRGDLDSFMEAYWNSPKLVFIGRNGPTYGWQQVLDNYKKNYPDTAAMGKLKFDILEISLIDKKTVFLIGKYQLTRTVGDAEGNFSLLLQKINGEWLIISDHSDVRI
jgi:uncharacterized protein (TIGR02246 family)